MQVDDQEGRRGHAEADLKAAEAQVRATLGLARSQRWKLQTAIEQVDNQVALLRARVAALKSKEATLELRAGRPQAGAQAALRPGRDQQGGIRSAPGGRAGGGGPGPSGPGGGLRDEGLSRPSPAAGEGGTVRRPRRTSTRTSPPSGQALAELVQSMAQVGLPLASSNVDAPSRSLEEFHSRDKEGNIDRDPRSGSSRRRRRSGRPIAKLLKAERDLAQAELNLRYCDIVSEIDGVVTRRNVNPGNNVAVGQSLMAVRSLTEIWIDANFKETQLADLRIGQRVRCEVDMYGSRREFEGRITGFTMGTGQTLALLPPQNATGNFVKIVQRLPVRVELTDYDPDKNPLFVGLSVVPYVYYKEPATGPHAGEVLQPPHATSARPHGARRQ